MGYRRKYLPAFTLMELLVVIAIIGILVAMLAPALERATERSRVAACAANLHGVGIGLQSYGNDYGAIPVGPGTPSPLAPGRPLNTVGSHQLYIAATAQYTGLALLLPGR